MALKSLCFRIFSIQLRGQYTCTVIPINDIIQKNKTYPCTALKRFSHIQVVDKTVFIFPQQYPKEILNFGSLWRDKRKDNVDHLRLLQRNISGGK